MSFELPGKHQPSPASTVGYSKCSFQDVARACDKFLTRRGINVDGFKWSFRGVTHKQQTKKP